MKSVRVVAGAVVRNGRVLVAQRAQHQSQALLWEFPGGKVEPGESDAMALRRELAEELGIEVNVGDVLGSNQHQYPNVDVELVLLSATLPTGEPVAREHARID